jgi:hypothetical protein
MPAPKHPWDSVAVGGSFTITEHKGFGRVQAYVHQRNYTLKPKRFTAFLNIDNTVTVTRRA